MTDPGPGILGVDIGSTAVSAVLLSRDGKIMDTYYQEHRGSISQCLANIDSSWKPYRDPVLVLTSSTHLEIPGFPYTDIQTASGCDRSVHDGYNDLAISDQEGLVRET